MNNTEKKTAAAPNRGKRKSHAQMVWHQYKKNTGAIIGLIFFILLVIGAIIAAFTVDYDNQIASSVPIIWAVTSSCA